MLLSIFEDTNGFQVARYVRRCVIQDSSNTYLLLMYNWCTLKVCKLRFNKTKCKSMKFQVKFKWDKQSKVLSWFYT